MASSLASFGSTIDTQPSTPLPVSGAPSSLTPFDYEGARPLPSRLAEGDEPVAAPTSDDYLTNFKAGLYGMAADKYSMQAQQATDPDSRKYYDDWAQYYRDYGNYTMSQMSDGGRQTAQSSILKSPHPFHTTLMGLTDPSNVVPLAAGAVGTVIGGPLAGVGAASLVSGSQAAMAADNTARDYFINQAPLDVLKKDPAFNAKLSVMSEDDARRAYATDKINDSLLEFKSGAAGAAAWALMGEEFTGLSPIRGRLGSVLAGTTLGTLGGAGQSAITNMALGVTAPGLQKTPLEIAQEAASAAIPMAGLGVLSGIAHPLKPHDLRDRIDKSTSGTQLDSTARGGEFTPVGSPHTSKTNAQKPDIVTPGVPDKTQATGSPPPSGIVSDDQAAAMGANQPTGPPPTPGVKETTEPTGGIQPGVVQPGAPAPEAPRMPAEAPIQPGLGPTTGEPRIAAGEPPRPPSVEPTGAPGVAPAPAAEPTGTGGAFTEGSPSVHDTFQNNIPETRATLEEQLNALANKQKQMMLITPGSNIQPDLIANVMKGDSKIKIAPLKDGSQAIYRTDGPDKLTRSKILKGVEANKLNDLLEMGPITQTEAVERTNAGQSPVAVTERTKEGTALKAAAGTTETAQAQAAALEKAKASPENTVQIEPVGKIIDERLADVRAAQAGLAAAEPSVTPRVEPGRVLKDISKPEEAGVTPSLVEKVEKPPEAAKAPARAEKRAANNERANEVMKGETIDKDEATAAMNLKNRETFIGKMQALADKGKAGEVEIPGRVQDNPKAPERNHNPNTLRLEAIDRLLKTYKKEGRPAFQRFIRHLAGIDEYEKTGDIKPLIADRVAEVKERRGLPDVGKKEYEAPVKTAEEEEAEKREALAKKEKEEQAAQLEARRKESEEMRAKGLEPSIITPGVTAEKPKVIVETVKRRRVTIPSERMEDVERPGYEPVQKEDEGEFETVSRGTELTRAKYLQKMTAKDALKLVNPAHFPEFTRGLVSKLIDHLTKIVGDVPVHIIDPDEMDKLDNAAETGMFNRTKGFYQPALDHVVLNASYLGKPEAQSHLILHELFHAATMKGLKDKVLGRLMDRLYNEVLNSFISKVPGARNIYEAMDQPGIVPRNLMYGLTKPLELLTEIISNPAWHEYLKKSNVSDELAQDLDIPKWRKPTMFNAALGWFTKLLGLTPRDYNVIEAAFSIAERAMWEREPAAELSYIYREHNLLSEFSKSEYSMSINDARESIAKVARDTGPTMRSVKRVVNNLVKLPLEWLDQAKQEKWAGGKVYDVGRTIMEAVDKASAAKLPILKTSEPLMRDVTNLQQSDPDQYRILGDALVASTSYGADLRDKLGSGKNAHIDPRDADTALEYHAAVATHPDDYNRFHSGFTKSGTRSLYGRIIDMFSKMNRDFIISHRDNMIKDMREEMKTSDLSYDHKQAIEKTINKQALDPDEQDRFGNDKFIRAIKDYDAATKKALKGPYFSLQRLDGDHVVTGTHEYKEPKSTLGSKVEGYDHRYAFDTNKKEGLNGRKNAFDFIKSLPAAIRSAAKIDIVRYLIDPDTGEKHYTVFDPKLGRHRDIRAADVPATGQLHEEYHVQVNPDHFEVADSEAHGEEIRTAMQAAGIKNVSEVLPRMNDAQWARGVNAQQVESIIDHIEGMKSKTRAEKDAAIQGLRHVVTAAMPGNRLSKSFLERQRTAGASRDIVAVMDRFRHTLASIQAMDPYRDTIAKALNQFENIAKDSGKADIVQMYNDFNKRVNDYPNQYAKDMKVNPNWNNWMSLINMKDLVSPAFFLLHQLHIPIRVAPDIAAEVGAAHGANIVQKIFRQGMGVEARVIGKSFSRALREAWRYDFEPTDVVDALSKEFKLSTDQQGMVKWLVDHNLMHNTGADYSQSYGRQTAFSRLAAKARNISQEALGSAEIFNRFSSSLMYLEAAKLKGLKGEDAYRYVYDHVAKTSGAFTPFHRMGILQDPRMRFIMQYRSWPMLLAKHTAKLMWNSLHPDTPWEVRARAFKELAYMTIAASVLSGVQGGTPYPIRMMDDLLSFTGLTAGWNKHMDELRHGLANELGVTGATAMMDGVGALGGLYLGHRGGISDPLGLNYLFETKPDEGGILKWLAGAPAGGAADLFSGAGKLMSGDPVGAGEMLLPRVFADPLKAYQDYVGGVQTRAGKVISPPLSLPQTIEEAFGLTPITRIHAQQARAVLGQEKQDQLQERTRISHEWARGNRATARQLLLEYNARYPQNRTNLANVIKSSVRPTILGYPETPRTRRQYLEEQHVYGLD